MTELPYPSSEVTHYLVLDTSKYAVGAALHQMIGNKPVPIGFFSKKETKQNSPHLTVSY